MVGDVNAWLEQLGLGIYAGSFAEQDIDLDVVPELTDADLRELGLSLGHRRKFLKAATELAAAESLPENTGWAATRPEAERRQLTVMFCDLVGSTALSARLEAEDMRDVIKLYQNAVAGNIARFDGHVAKFMGDGILAYFGYPRAHEDDVERAVRAGLATTEAIGSLSVPAGGPLSVRIGIATGLVVVGDLVGAGAAQEEAVIGETPNLAARLQSAADPGQVWIADTTRQLLGNGFELDDLGSRMFKGFKQPERAFAVKGELAMESRFEAKHRDLPQMVGREHELSLLLERWSLIKASEGQCIVLTGEAGIGKSRLVQALIDAVSKDDHIRVGLQCSPFHQGSPLWPVIQYLKRGSGIVSGDPPEIRLVKLETFLRQGAETPDRKTVELISELFNVDRDTPVQPADSLPQDHRSRTLDALASQIVGLARSKPVLVVLEDAHWIDPTTLEMIDYCLGAIVHAPVFIMLTSRPEGEPELKGRASIMRLTLGQLSRSSLGKLVRACGGDKLSQTTIDTIVSRTDGIPLFAEELTKSVVETGDAGIPTSLYDSLMARLDRIPDAKTVVQAASCIGREFDQTQLKAIVEMPEGALSAILDRLVDAGVLLHFGGRQSESFIFKHVLVRNVAYESMLRNERKARHGVIADHLQKATLPGERGEPEVVAYHLEQAHMFEPSARNWFAACRISLNQSADREAIAHAESALRCIDNVNPSKGRDQLELEILVSYGTAVLSSKGWASSEIAAIYTRVGELADKLGKIPEQFVAAWNLWLFNIQRGNTDEAHELVDHVLTFSRQIGDDEAKMQAHHAAWTTLFNFAPLATVRQHLDQGLMLYNRKQHQHSWTRYGGHDACVCGCGHAAWLTWFEGSSDTALAYAARVKNAAEDVGHAYSQLVSWFFLSSIHYYRRDADMVVECSSSGMELADNLGLAQHDAISRIFRGWGIGHSGSPADGLEEVRLGLQQLDQLNVSFRRTFYLTILADACLNAGFIEEALSKVQLALELSDKNKETRWLPELLRLKALASRHDGSSEGAESDALLRESISLAREDGARIFELRAATDLARSLREANKFRAANKILMPVYECFVEGLDTPDLIEARKVLEDLH